METLGETLGKVEAKVFADTHSEKLRGRVTDLGNAMANVQGIGTGQPIG